MTGRAVLVVVPTTGGPLRLRSLRARAGLPASAAFAEGDYRPLPWSADYARLAAPGGPLSRIPGAAESPHELRLDGSFDAGRSWEVPVCLAHGLLAAGHRLVADPGAADLVLWATGAVDLDLAVLPGDYALSDKIERSRALLEEAPQAELVLLLPDGPERAEAERSLSALGRRTAPRILPGGDIPAALAAFPAAEPTTRPAPTSRGRRWTLAAAGACVLAALGVTGLVHGRLPASGSGADGAETPAQTAPMPTHAAGTFAPEETGPAAPASPGPAPAILVEELSAPAGSSCRRVAFGADAPVRNPVPMEGEGRLRASRLSPELCGLAFRAAGPGLRLEIGPELRGAALPPQRAPDGSQSYFLREAGRQNLVYTVQAISESGANPPAARLTHALVR